LLHRSCYTGVNLTGVNFTGVNFQVIYLYLNSYNEKRMVCW
jgi:uncharacterized protein YjbI with pentapeptide repeats